MTQLGRLLIVGFSLFALGFSPLRKWTFGVGYNHPAVVLQLFFKLGPLHLVTLSYLMYPGLVLTIRAN